jgi:hypothetical protein
MGEAPDPVLSEPQYLLGDEALFDWVEDNLAEIVGADKTLLEEILIDEGVLDQEQPPKKTRKSRIRVKDWWSTAWGIMLQNPDIRDINTRDGKQFRRRYRLPANFFLDWLVPKCKEVNLFNAKRKANGDLMGQIPIEFKLLIGLRILGRGNCFDDIAEASQAGESTVHAIFQEFVLSFSKEFKDSFIFVPEGDELGAILNTHEEYNLREQVGLGGYAVYINAACVLDCQPFLNVCKASFANSPYKCINNISRVEVVANTKFSYDSIRRKARLIAIVEIPPDTEILWLYSPHYRYPVLPIDT